MSVILLSNITNVQEQRENAADTPLHDHLEKTEIKIIATEEELHGPERFISENMATSQECDMLVELTNSGAVVGEGYGQQTRSSPHTDHEKYAGMTVVQAAELSLAGKVSKAAAKLFLDMAERARQLVEAYFDVQPYLYFDYTQLVCRTALDPQMKRSDLSHPIHSDNCILQPDNTCIKERPAYIQRDYSALLYLSDDYSGGEIFFVDDNMTAQSSFHPGCGQMVGFNASNLHGVKAVRRGQRCALAMWFTLDEFFDEVGHRDARDMLKSASMPRAEDPRRATDEL